MTINKVSQLRYLLFQIRKPDDPMRKHEVDCFAQELGCPPSNIRVHDLISGPPKQESINQASAVLIGGSGDYSVVEGGPWLNEALATFRDLFEQGKPTFASCWGFQAFARALGGVVVTDLSRAELGTLELSLTEGGLEDPLFKPLGSTFKAQLGHQDIVDRLPAGAVCLASSKKVENEAFMFPEKLIYATQFHPELSKSGLLMRLKIYPTYVERISGLSFEEFVASCSDTPETSHLLSRFAEQLLK